jgi:hypothetical protein
VLAGHRGEGAIEILGAGHLDGLKLQMPGPRRRLGFLVVEHRASHIGIPEHRHPGEPGHGFPQQLEPFPAELRRDIAEPGDISAGAREAGHEPGPDRIEAVRHDDRDRRRFSLECRRRHVVACDDHLDLVAHELAGELRKSLGPGLAVAHPQHERFPFDIPKLA